MLTASSATTGVSDAAPLAHTAQLVASIDGKVEPAEQAALDALCKTVPQLKGQPLPARITRRQLLDLLGTLESEALRRQCFVIAVEMALASGQVNESEDQFVEMIYKSLGLELSFATQVIQVIACKYARGR